jgi:hypothetical protein
MKFQEYIMSRINTLSIFLLIIIVSSFYVPIVRADEDLMKKASNISVVVPTQGNAILGTSESMYQFYYWLIECGYRLILLFNQITNLLGITNIDYTNKMQETLQTGLNQTYGLIYSSPNTLTI